MTKKQTTKPAHPTDDAELEDLKNKIEKMTGRRPTCDRVRQLRRHHKTLIEKFERGEPIRRYGDPKTASKMMGFSIPKLAAEQLESITEKHGGLSEIVRGGLKLWAIEHGYSKLVDAIGGA